MDSTPVLRSPRLPRQVATAGFGTPSTTTWMQSRHRQQQCSSRMLPPTPKQFVWARAASCCRTIHLSQLPSSSARLRRCIPIASTLVSVVLRVQTKSLCKHFDATRAQRNIFPKTFLNFRRTSATQPEYLVSMQHPDVERMFRSTSLVPHSSVRNSQQYLVFLTDSLRTLLRISYVKPLRCIARISVLRSNLIIPTSLPA